MEVSDKLSIYTKTTPCWIHPNFCAPRKTWQNHKIINKTDVFWSCNTTRMGTKRRFFKFLDLRVFAALLKDVPMGFNDAALPEPPLKNTRTAASRLKRTQDNPLMTTCAFYVRLLSICTENNGWENKLRKFSLHSWKKSMDTVPISSR